MEALTGLPELRVPTLAPTERLVSVAPVALRRASDGAAPRLRTALRVARRNGALLVRFDGKDDGWVGTRTRRDDALWEEDVYEVFLTPDEPPHTYFEFEVNPLGTLFDATVLSPHLSRPTICIDVLWNCPGYRARVRKTATSWSASLTIPLEPLCPGRTPPSVWRANFYRVDRGSATELSAWSPIHRAPVDFHEARRFGRLLMRET